MARYLAIPKRDVSVSVLSRATVRFDTQARMSQIDELRRVRNDPSLRSQVPVKASFPPKVLDRYVELELTGVHVIDTDPVHRELLSDALPDYEIREDEPLPLIEPTRSGVGEDESKLDLWHLNAIGLTDARASGFNGTGAGVGVAVLDTGIAEVPEIRGRVKASFTLDRNSNRWIRGQTHDTDGHGTHVAGLVAGSRVGVAPGVELTNIIMIPKGRGRLSDFVSAIEFVAADPEISILNMSAGIPGYRDGMRVAVEAIMQTGVLPVIAVGNEGRKHQPKSRKLPRGVVGGGVEEGKRGRQFLRRRHDGCRPSELPDPRSRGARRRGDVLRHGWQLRELERHLDGNSAGERVGGTDCRTLSHHKRRGSAGGAAGSRSRAPRCSSRPPGRGTRSVPRSTSAALIRAGQEQYTEPQWTRKAKHLSYSLCFESRREHVGAWCWDWYRARRTSPVRFARHHSRPGRSTGRR